MSMFVRKTEVYKFISVALHMSNVSFDNDCMWKFHHCHLTQLEAEILESPNLSTWLTCTNTTSYLQQFKAFVRQTLNIAVGLVYCSIQWEEFGDAIFLLSTVFLKCWTFRLQIPNNGFTFSSAPLILTILSLMSALWFWCVCAATFQYTF